MIIDLEREDFEGLLLMAGYALGCAAREKDSSQMILFLALANKINANNPDWTPYEIPDAWKSDSAPPGP